ncbi:hypothetical protein DB347_07715 [Opitutaceae bacterium EW11]|nr:hypothetical protein DB347_07715 [Opitutaceae bacterium EW11]
MKLAPFCFILVATLPALRAAPGPGPERDGAPPPRRNEAPAPRRDSRQIDGSRIINESYSFKKNQEPEMSADEYAIYEKVVGMVAVNPEFALKLMATMTAGEKPTPAFEFVLGNIYFTNGKPEVAETHFRNAVRMYPDFTRAWTNLGVLLYNQHNYQEAAECFTKVVSKGEGTAENLGLLAYCLDKTGRKTAAEMNYIQAVGLDPDNVGYLSGLLSLYLESKQYARAEPLLQQLTRLQPDDRRNWAVYASLLVAEDRKLDAVAILQGAAALDLLDEEGRAMLCDLYASLQFHREANEAYAELRKRSPSLAQSRQLAYTQSLIGEKKYLLADQALGELEKAGVSGEAGIPIWLAKGSLCIGLERWADARVGYQKVLDLSPLNPDALLGMARVEKATNNLARAEVFFEQAAQQPSTAQRACLELAELAIKSRRYPRALGFLEKAVAIERSPALEMYIARIRTVVAAPEGTPVSR